MSRKRQRKDNQVQNSFGPRRSSLASHVIRVAAAIITPIPATLTAACIAKPPEIPVRITKPANDSKTLKQYIDSEFSPQRIIAVIQGFISPCQSGGVSRETTIASARKCTSRTGARWLL